MKAIIDVGSQCNERIFSADDFPELKAQGIHCAGLSELHQHHRIVRQFEQQVMLSANLQGEAALNTDELCTTLRAGQLLFMPAETPFELQLTEAGYRQTAWLLLEERRWRALGTKSWVMDTDFGLALNHCLESLYLERAQRPNSTVRRLLSEQLVAYLDRLVAAKGEEQTDYRLSELMRQISLRPGERWSQSDMCATAGLSKSHLHRLCQQQLGCSAKALLLKARMEQAQTLLRHSDYPITIIGLSLGYNTPEYFATQFKRFNGVSPRSFRQSYHNNVDS